MVAPIAGPPSTESPVSKSKSMMEVDMQSPPSTFRPVAFTIKRPRSPGSPTQERHTKRLSLAPLGLEGQCARRASTVPGGMVANHDDWVRQARELSIASPLSLTVGFPSPLDAHGSTTVAPGRADEHMPMAVDDDDQAPTLRVHPTGGARPWTTTRSHLPLIHITTAAPAPATQTAVPVPSGLQAPSPAPFSVLTEPSSSSSSAESASSTSSISVTEASVDVRAHHPRPPDIFLLPATPSDTPSHPHSFPTEYGTQARGERGTEQHARMHDQARLSQSSSTQTQAQDRIDGSPRPSRAPDIPSSSGRKHRVTMGPRADCAKCRTGVRGHWMHFD